MLTALLARDNFLPHMFGLRADRQVHRYGVVVLAILAGALLVAANGNTQALVPLFAVGVFIGFTLSQLGMVKHWYLQRSRGWMGRAVINGVCAFLTTLTTIIELISKFTEGAWLIVLVIPSLVLPAGAVRPARDRSRLGRRTGFRHHTAWVKETRGSEAHVGRRAYPRRAADRHHRVINS